MKYYKYSQYVYLIAGIAFLISAAYKFFKNDDYGMQLIIGVVFIITYFVRSVMLKRITQNQKK